MARHARPLRSGRPHAHPRRLPDLPDADVAARAFALIWGTQAAMVEFVDTPRGETGPLLDALLLQWETCLSAAG